MNFSFFRSKKASEGADRKVELAQNSDSMKQPYQQAESPVAEVRLIERKLRPSKKAQQRLDQDEASRQQDQPQFATLQELFRHKFGQKQQQQQSQSSQDQPLSCEEENKFKTRIPVMKLSKDDWNVKCWEDRLKPDYLRSPKTQVRDPSHLRGSSMDEEANREIKRIFNERIDDVSNKLDKIRIGEPMDETLHQLATSKFKRRDLTSERPTNKPKESATSPGGRIARESHGWIDLLKSELVSGKHNSKVLRSELESKAAPSSQGPKSPLGRPIRRIFEDDEDDVENDVNESNKRS